AVVGAGIAPGLATAGREVRCHDVTPDALAAAGELIDPGRFGVRSAVERGKLTAEEADGALGRVGFPERPEDLHRCELVIEAIPERLDLKIAAFRELDRR